jgi:hypothetical protein
MDPLMIPSRRNRLFATLGISVILSGLTVVAGPLVPGLGTHAGQIVSREVETSVDGTRTVELPITATHVELHWVGSRDAHVTVAFAPEAGSFGEAIPVDPEYPAEGADAGRTSSAMLWAGDARYARITSDVPLSHLVVTALSVPSDPGSATGGPVVQASVGQHTIITRAQWGADESLRFDSAGREVLPESYFPLQQFIVHHTAGRNGDPNPAATIRAIYYDHAILRRFGDIDYSFLIDEAGNIYEGRHARDYAPGEIPTSEDLAGNLVRPTHAAGFNPGSMGIALLGDFTSQQPTAVARASLVWLLAWAAARHGLDPTATHTYVNGETGAQKVLPVIAGHRDVAVTACPGNAFYSTFPALRSAVAAKIAASNGTTVDKARPNVMTFAVMEPATTGARTLHVGLTLDEPVSGLTAADFKVGGTSSGWTISSVSGTAAAYTITLKATTPTPGSVILTFAALTVVDKSGNAGPAIASQATVQWAPDSQAPSVVLFPTDVSSSTTGAGFDVTVRFSEPVATVTSAAVVLGGSSQAATPWTVSFVYGSGAKYDFYVSNPHPASGTLTITLRAGATADLAGNPSLAASTLKLYAPWPGGSYHSLPTTRLVDTRLGNGLVGTLRHHIPRTFTVAGRGGVPATATAIIGNVIVTGQSRAGSIFVGPVATVNPTTPTLSFGLAGTRVNGVRFALGPGGTLSATYVSATGATTQLVFEVTGYYTP